MTHISLSAAFAAGLVLLAAPCLAQSIHPVSLTGSADTDSSVHALGADHSVILSRSTYTIMRDARADSPLNGLRGPCFGMMEIEAKAVTGNGYCAYDDPDGEKVVFRWTAEALGADGEIEGQWTLVDGTGKWTGATGSGSFESLTARKTGRTMNFIRGEVALR